MGQGFKPFGEGLEPFPLLFSKKEGMHGDKRGEIPPNPQGGGSDGGGAAPAHRILDFCWLLGLADVRGEVFHLPLWAVAGTIGTWCFAILLVKFLTSVVFKDMSLEDDAAAASAKGDGKRG